MRNNIRKLGYLLLSLLLILIFYLSYIQLEKGSYLAEHPRNKRFIEKISQTERGKIYDRNGEIIAESLLQENHWKRYYPYQYEISHLVGYTSDKYGTAGVEAAYNKQLLGLTDRAKFLNFIGKIYNENPEGEEIFLTIDIKIQRLAAELLTKTNKPGAVVALRPSTGEILVAASIPGYNPNKLEETWDELLNDENAPLLNRAFQGAYPPGSVMKLVTAAGALSNGYNGKEKFNCPGYLEVDGFRLLDSEPHGTLNIHDGVVVSCNTIFGKLGLELGTKEFIEQAEQFGFGSDFGIPLNVRTSTISKDKNMDTTELAEAAIGQGELLVSPLQMALVASAIANQGEMKQPYLVDEIVTSKGKTLHQNKPRTLLQSTDSSTARYIGEAMVDAVKLGTGKAARISDIKVAGKTGTAENEHGSPHAWFVGFAPAENPQVAVAVVVENGGAGGTVAAPIAKQVILEALR
ncbi:MAG: hypothetical protein FH758_02835 [Firmicutes bacterium]|nr:hypothetical protein [Bacillota bacterium]